MAVEYRSLDLETAEAIAAMVDRLYASIIGSFVGRRRGKQIIFASEGLPSLFLRSIGRLPSESERHILDTVIRSAHNYLESSREETKSRILDNIDSLIADSALKNKKLSQDIIQTTIANELDRAETRVRRIVEASSTRARNSGAALDIIRAAGPQFEDGDPTVFFVVVRDQNLCSECKRLHLLPDELTPKVYKMSELGFGYHKKGEDNPKVSGLHPHCFTENMLLHTSSGIRSFKDLYEQGGCVDVVVDNRIVPRKSPSNQFGTPIPGSSRMERHYSGNRIEHASNVYDTGIRDCYKITLKSGHSIEVSEDHEMWVDDNNVGIKVKAKDINIGDKIPLINGEGRYGEDHFPELAELMGNLMGDGSISNHRAQWNFFGDSINYGNSLLELARPFCGFNLSNTLTIKGPDSKYSVDRASFVSTSLQKIFVEEFDLSKKPRRVPKRIFSADKETVCSFLRGLYAADGHSEKTPSVVLAQNDLEFLKEIQILLSTVGLVSRIYSHGEVTVKDITYANGEIYTTNRRPCWRMHIGGREQCIRFFDEIGMGVPEKQKKLENQIETSYKKNKTKFSWRTSTVESIEYIGKQQTYSITEHMTNTVAVNGITTGQCRCSMTPLSPGFGFKHGRVTWIGKGHNEYEHQRSQ